jgi:hypothetical protein
VEFLDDVAFRGLTKDSLLECVPSDYKHSFLFVVDSTAINNPEFPILVVDLRCEPGRSFRAIPSAIQSIENRQYGLLRICQRG